MILNLKTYAFFVHNVLGEPLRTYDGKVINELSSQETLTRDKNIETICGKLIFEFEKIDLDLSEEIMGKNNLTSKFNELEENILKLMDKKFEIDKELKMIEEKIIVDQEVLNIF
jgi:hypothetical protein